jgi:hypothetical protein
VLSSLIDGKPSQVVNQPNRLKRNGNHLADEANDVLGIVGAVRVVDDVGALVGRDAVLINDRFEGAAIAEAVFVDFGRDAAEGEEAAIPYSLFPIPYSLSSAFLVKYLWKTLSATPLFCSQNNSNQNAVTRG